MGTAGITINIQRICRMHQRRLTLMHLYQQVQPVGEAAPKPDDTTRGLLSDAMCRRRSAYPPLADACDDHLPSVRFRRRMTSTSQAHPVTPGVHMHQPPLHHVRCTTRTHGRALTSDRAGSPTIHTLRPGPHLLRRTPSWCITAVHSDPVTPPAPAWHTLYAVFVQSPVTTPTTPSVSPSKRLSRPPYSQPAESPAHTTVYRAPPSSTPRRAPVPHHHAPPRLHTLYTPAPPSAPPSANRNPNIAAIVT